MARSTTYVTFTVRGSGVFPFDMLRYDGCWPKRGEDVVSIQQGMRHGPRSTSRREITLEGVKDPTVERWVSFGWEPVQP